MPISKPVKKNKTSTVDRKVLKRYHPQMPRYAALEGINGSVQLAFDISAEGEPENIEVLKAFPPKVFNLASVRAIKNWRFEPADKATQYNVQFDYYVGDAGLPCKFRLKLEGLRPS